MNHVRLLGMARNLALQPSSVEAMGRRVVARFWALLEDFRVVGPPDSFASVGPQPFLRFDGVSGQWALGRRFPPFLPLIVFFILVSVPRLLVLFCVRRSTEL